MCGGNRPLRQVSCGYGAGLIDGVGVGDRFEEAQEFEHHRAERLSHALYGLIIVTATLVAEKDHIEEPAEALAVLASVALVLLLAHTYSAWLAEQVVETGHMGKIGRRMVVKDNLPVAMAILVPALFFGLAWLDLVALQTAYVVSIAFSLIALIGLGIYQGRAAAKGWQHTVVSGGAAAAIGLVVIALEALFE